MHILLEHKRLLYNNLTQKLTQKNKTQFIVIPIAFLTSTISEYPENTSNNFLSFLLWSHIQPTSDYQESH